MKKGQGLITIGLIYANWCGHCQALKPEWKKMKHSMMKSPKKHMYKFVEIEDADKKKDQRINALNASLKGQKVTANGYPTILKINGGKLDYYQGEREAAPLMKWFSGENKQVNQNDYNNNSRNNNGVYGMMRNMFGGKTKKRRK
jgi:hypothetical protein